MNTQTVSEKYNILPSAGLLLFPEDVEKDDYLHNPDPNDKENMKFTDLFTKRGMANIGGLALITLGLLTLFIGYPIMYVCREPAQLKDLSTDSDFAELSYKTKSNQPKSITAANLTQTAFEKTFLCSRASAAD